MEELPGQEKLLASRPILAFPFGFYTLLLGGMLCKPSIFLVYGAAEGFFSSQMVEYERPFEIAYLAYIGQVP
jgi:hypothetical protein